MIKGVEFSPVFEKLHNAIESGKYNIFLLEGGSRSSKTWSIIQKLILLSLNNNYRISCFRKQSTWARDTIWQDFILNLKNVFDLYERGLENKSVMDYRIEGSTFEFRGLDDIERTRSRTQDITWINEVTDISKDIFDELEQRTNKFCILDYNPVFDQSWVYDLRNRPDVFYIHSTMLDNPFLPKKIKDKINSYKPCKENEKIGTVDLYKWTVYGLGHPARREGTVFTNWEEKEIPLGANLIGYGLDFGYTNDPTALVGVYEHNNEYYLDELLYEPGLTNDDISKKMTGFAIEDDIIADSSEPKSIEEIARKGFRISGVAKGADSINYGVSIVQEHKCYYTPRSTNIALEFRNYIWKQDRDGKATNKPIDDFNHIMDAIRYVFMEKVKTKKAKKSLEDKRLKIERLKRQMRSQGISV